MRFSDELIGSEGEKCLVMGIAGPDRPGVITEVIQGGKLVHVKLDIGPTIVLGFERITLVSPETP